MNCGKILVNGAIKGNLRDVEKALANGADIDLVDTDLHGPSLSIYGTAMKIAAVRGHMDIVRYLIDEGANPYIPYDFKFPRDVVLNNNGRKDIADYLMVTMKLPKVLNRIDDTSGYTPLTYCIKNTFHDKAQELMDLGADVCKMDRHEKRPLTYAIEAGSSDMVKSLLEKGAGASGVSALKCALDSTSNELAKCLVETKPELVNANLSDDFTPLTKSIINCNVDMVKFLTENGADPTKPDRNGNIPFDKALEIHSIEIVEILFSKIRDSNFTLKINSKLMHQFAEDGNVDVYRFLIQNNWNVEQTDDDGKTSLALSATHKHLLLTEFLIENGADMGGAKAEIDNFRKTDIDFDSFLEVYCPKNDIQETWNLTGTGHE